MTGTKLVDKGKLTAKQERYVKARVQGMDSLTAMRWAGFTIKEDVKESTLIKKALNYDRQPFIQARIAEVIAKENMQDVGKKMANIAAAIEKYNPDDVDRAMLNTGTMAVFRRALDIDNFSSALSALKFMAEMNGIATARKPGRQRRDVPSPTEDTGGNYDFDTDNGATPASTEGDNLFDAFGGSDGAVPQNKKAPPVDTAPDNRKRDAFPETQPGVDDDDGGFDEFDDGDVGSAGEDGGEVS